MYSATSPTNSIELHISMWVNRDISQICLFSSFRYVTDVVVLVCVLFIVEVLYRV